MSEIFFTSDNHFFHKKILEFCPKTRIAKSVEEMNEKMIDNWNEQVKSEDTVYCLGDFSFGNEKETKNVLSRLSGHKKLIWGNHDKVIMNDAVIQSAFDSIKYYDELNIDKIPVILFHFPIYEWNKMHYGSFHLYGHVHGGADVSGRCMDVGIDTRPNGDMKLWTWGEIKAKLSALPIRKHHRVIL